MKVAVMALAAALLAVAPPTPVVAQHAEQATSLFTFDGASGYDPQAGVITDARGTIFGTTSIGGAGPCLGDAGCGTVFALSPPTHAGGAWLFNKIYDFQGGQDGESPFAQLTLGPGGTLYGYPGGGTPGTVFRLVPPTVPDAEWTFDILYVFTGKSDGNLLGVTSPFVLRHGSLYGVASGGGSGCGQAGCGSVFQLTPPATVGGAWSYAEVWSFNNGPDRNPQNVVTGRGGRLFGVLNGGDSSGGSLFEIH